MPNQPKKTPKFIHGQQVARSAAVGSPIFVIAGINEDRAFVIALHTKITQRHTASVYLSELRKPSPAQLAAFAQSLL